MQNKRKKMSLVWKTVKKTMNCKSCKSEVCEPKPMRRNRKKNVGNSMTVSKSCKSPMKDVVYGKRNNATNCSPMSVRSSELINPVTHHVRFTNSGLRIAKDHNAVGGSPYFRSGFNRTSMGIESSGGGGYRPEFCNKCGESLARQDAEVHHLSKHAVTEVLVGDSARKIIEMIFKTGWTRTTINRITIDTILKVHNPETKLAHFEEHREIVKIRAHKQQLHSKRHPRCLADGNELLRFYGTTLKCALGQNGTSSLCNSRTCRLCCILRHGFSGYSETDKSVLGIYTTSTSERAYKSIEMEGNEARLSNVRKALIMCRVIAGRVHKPMVDSSQELVGGGRRTGFDSFAGKLGSNSCHIEDLYVLKPSALLPCFVIVCKP